MDLGARERWTWGSPVFRCGWKGCFDCPLALTIVAPSRNRCEAPVLPLMFQVHSCNPACLALLRLCICMQIIHHRGALGRWLYLANWKLSFWDPNYPMDCAMKRPCMRTAASSCVQPRIAPPKNGHVSYDARAIAKSCCAPTCFFSIFAQSKCSYLVRRRKHSVWMVVRIRACLTAHPPKLMHGASCVEPNASLLLWIAMVYTCILRDPLAPFFHTVWSGLLPIVQAGSLVATLATTDHKLSWNIEWSTSYLFSTEKLKHTTLEYRAAHGNSNWPPWRALTFQTHRGTWSPIGVRSFSGQSGKLVIEDAQTYPACGERRCRWPRCIGGRRRETCGACAAVRSEAQDAPADAEAHNGQANIGLRCSSSH